MDGYYFRIDARNGDKGYAEYTASVGTGQYGREPVSARMGIAVKHSVEGSDYGAEVFCFDISLSFDPDYLPGLVARMHDSDLYLAMADVVDYVAKSYRTDCNNVTFSTDPADEDERKVLDEIRSRLLVRGWAEVPCWPTEGKENKNDSGRRVLSKFRPRPSRS